MPSNKEYEVIIDEWLIGDASYKENGVSIAGKVKTELPDVGYEAGIIVTTFPNPCKGESNLRINVATTTGISIDLVTIDGKMVRQLLPETLITGGSYLYRFNLSDLTQGNYFYRITTKEQVITQSLFIIK